MKESAICAVKQNDKINPSAHDAILVECTYLPSQGIELGFELGIGLGLHIEYKFAIYHCLKKNSQRRRF
jgi:hypothetical protein